ncbi:hypothetical protein AX16_008449 [Volvariella volvacea WC 439]|nr:hypothetical protein AX16_008449 [Volvariella volvacea WC 439]
MDQPKGQRQQSSAIHPSLTFRTDSMTNDLTPQKDKPLWPLSCYGPAKHEPTLLGGLDESQEELRVRAFTANRAGTVNEYISYESSKIAAAEQVFANARTNVVQAYDQAIKQSPSQQQQQPTSAFGGLSAFGSSTTPSAPAAFGGGATTSFGKPAFGQPAFGQPAFGQTTAPTTTTPAAPAFGQPPQPLTPTSAFGQPSQPQSSLIKPATGAFASFAGSGTSPFGAGASGGGAFSAFASQQPTAFGAGAGAAAGSASAPAFGGGGSSGAFGAPSSTIAPLSAFGAPTFGAPATFGGSTQPPSISSGPASGFSAFGGGSASAGPTNAFSAFGGGASASASQPQTTSAFGQPTNAFSASTSGLQPASVFGQSSLPSNPTTAPSPFGSIPPTTMISSPSASMTPAPSKGPELDFAAAARNSYKPNSTPYDSQLPQNYMEMVPQEMMEAFKADKFEWGKVPEWIPPLQLR